MTVEDFISLIRKPQTTAAGIKIYEFDTIYQLADYDLKEQDWIFTSNKISILDLLEIEILGISLSKGINDKTYFVLYIQIP